MITSTRVLKWQSPANLLFCCLIARLRFWGRLPHCRQVSLLFSCGISRRQHKYLTLLVITTHDKQVTGYVFFELSHVTAIFQKTAVFKITTTKLATAIGFSWELKALDLLQPLEESSDCTLLSWLCDDSNLAHMYFQVASLHKRDAVESISKLF